MKKAELEFFKNLLLDRREQILKNINDSSDEIVNLRDSDVVDEFDLASINADSNLNYSITLKQQEEIASIDRALTKIENGSYGICEMCEEEINYSRLKAKPQARHCIACREIIEKTSKNK